MEKVKSKQWIWPESLPDGIKTKLSSFSPLEQQLLYRRSITSNSSAESFLKKELTNTDDPYEAGLGFVVDLAKPDFIGKAFCVERKAQGPALDRRLLQVLVSDPEPLLYHAEPVYRNDRAVGYIRMASYGHTLGGAIGLAMIEAGEPINKAYLAEGEWEVDIAGTRYPATVSLRPMYDPKMERIKA